MPSSNSWLPVLGLAGSLLATACGAPPRDRHVQPQRPTFGSNTRTTSEDVLEVELGVALKPNRPREELDMPLTLKLGLGPRTELFGGLSLFRSSDGEEGFGDSLVGVRHRLWDETYSRPATAVQLATKLPSASESKGLGSGAIDFFAAGIHTRTIDRSAFSLFYQLGLLGDAGEGGHDGELAVAGTLDFGLTPRVTTFGELAGRFQPENDIEAVFLTVGGAFRYAPWMYLDAGLAVGLTDDAPDLLLLLGLTRSAGRVLGLASARAAGP